MALPDILHLVELTSLRARAQYGDAGRIQRIWVVTFLGRVRSHEDFDLIEQLPFVPAPRSAYKPGDYRTRRDVDVAAMDETQQQFIVTANYEASPAGEENPDPLLRKDTISGDFTPELKPYYEDVNGKPAIMTNGQPFLTPPKRLCGNFQISVTGNRPILPGRASEWATYIYPQCSYNASDVLICGREFGAKKLLLTGLGFSTQAEGSTRFERWTWKLTINPKGWDIAAFESRGFEQVASIGGKNALIKIMDDTCQQQVTLPYPLKEDGSKGDSQYSKPYMVELFPYKEQEFAPFGWSTEL